MGPGAFILTSNFLPVVLSRGFILACSVLSLLLAHLINTCLCFPLVKPQRLMTGLEDWNNNCVVKGLGKRSLSFLAAASGFPRAFSIVLSKPRDSCRHAGGTGSRRLCDREARLLCGEQSPLQGLALPDSESLTTTATQCPQKWNHRACFWNVLALDCCHCRMFKYTFVWGSWESKNNDLLWANLDLQEMESILGAGILQSKLYCCKQSRNLSKADNSMNWNWWFYQ